MLAILQYINNILLRLAALEDEAPDYGLAFYGTVTTATSDVQFSASGLADKGNDYFKGYYVYPIWDAGGAGAAPQGEYKLISDYVSTGGDFVHTAFTADLVLTDKVLIVHPSIVRILDIYTDTQAILADTGTAGVVVNSRTSACEKLVGVLQQATTTESLNQAAATYDLFTGTTQAVTLEKLSVKMPTGAAGGSITSISIQTDDATPGVIIDSTTGAVANLTSEAELAWTGMMLINTDTKIQLTIAGGAHGSAYTATIIAECRAVVSGGYLA